MVLAFTTVTAVLGSSLSRGLASLLFGLALGLVGIDSQSGQARFTLGVPELLDGIDVIVVSWGCSPWARRSTSPAGTATSRRRSPRSGARSG